MPRLEVGKKSIFPHLLYRGPVVLLDQQLVNWAETSWGCLSVTTITPQRFPVMWTGSTTKCVCKRSHPLSVVPEQ